MEDRRYYKSLTRNMIMIMILVSFTPLILITGLIGYNFETSYRGKVLAHLQELLEKHQQNINAFLDEKLSYVKVLADSFTYEELTNEAFLENKLSILRNAYSGVFADLGVIDSSGVQVAYAGNLKLDRANYLHADWFREAMKRNYYVSDVFLGLRRTPHFIIAVKKGNPGSEWILRATIDFFVFNSMVENIRIGRTGSAFIINTAGEFQTQARTDTPPNMASLLTGTSWAKATEEKAGGSVPAGHTPFPRSVKETPPHGFQQASGSVTTQDTKLIYILMPLKGGEWTLAYLQEETDAFSEIRRARTLSLIIFSVGGLAIVFMAVFLSHKVVRRIERADQEKELMNEQVIEAGKLASIGELAAGIAHEINNPVAIMVEEAGWMEDLLQEEEMEKSENFAEFQRALKQINVQGDRCKEITHKLLSFARRTDPVHHDVQVNELVEEILSIFDQRSKFGNIKISSKLDPGLPVISASPSELQQVFMNLINNAIDAMGTQGGSLEIRSKVDGDWVVVDVSDTGHGIPKEIMARMFDPFFTTKPVGKGTGLGLSICYGIIKKLGGNITVSSSVGLGTTFHVFLPLPRKDS